MVTFSFSKTKIAKITKTKIAKKTKTKIAKITFKDDL